MSHRDVFLPFPELLDPGPDPYEIFDSRYEPFLPTSGMVDKEARALWAPLDAAGRSTTLHEMAHVAWSPVTPRPGSVHATLVSAVEDARINRGLERVGLAGPPEPELVERVMELAAGDLERGDVGAFAVRAIASLGTGLTPRLLARIPADAEGLLPRLPILVAEIEARLERARRKTGADAPLATFRRGREVARWLEGQLASWEVAIPKLPQQVVVCCGGHLGHGTGGRGRGPRGRDPRRHRAGRLAIDRPLLTEPCERTPARRQRRWRAAAEGDVIRYFHRHAVDQHVFRRRRRRQGHGGSVLVDVSGSMGFAPEDVERAIAHAPSATLVAIYSGHDDHGELRIVVRDGRRAPRRQLRPFGPCNVVDLPALEWLARQPPPRIWISDGRVTGCGDLPSASLERECDRVCHRAGIVRVESAEEAADWLEGRRRS